MCLQEKSQNHLPYSCIKFDANLGKWLLKNAVFGAKLTTMIQTYPYRSLCDVGVRRVGQKHRGPWGKCFFCRWCWILGECARNRLRLYAQSIVKSDWRSFTPLGVALTSWLHWWASYSCDMVICLFHVYIQTSQIKNIQNFPKLLGNLGVSSKSLPFMGIFDIPNFLASFRLHLENHPCKPPRPDHYRL